MKNNFCFILFLLFTVHCSLFTVIAQTPTVEKVEPPNWWANGTVNPVRVLIRGKNLTGAKITATNKDVSISNPRTSANGNYLFVDVEIKKNARTGSYPIEITTANGMVNAPFGIFSPIARQGNYQGFTPDDVIYFLMPDRFSDGDQSNNNPEKSKGLYDRTKGRFYHGGDLQA